MHPRGGDGTVYVNEYSVMEETGRVLTATHKHLRQLCAVPSPLVRFVVLSFHANGLRWLWWCFLLPAAAAFSSLLCLLLPIASWNAYRRGVRAEHSSVNQPFLVWAP